MEWLIILGIVVSIWNSISESKKAKMKKEARDSSTQQSADSDTKSVGEFHLDDIFDKLSDLMDTISKPFSDLSGQETATPKNHKKNVKKKQKPAAQSQQTMFEQIEQTEGRSSRGRRETKRQERKPLTASVQPIKNIYENDELCEHRIELNPNIHYQSQELQRTEAGLENISIQASPDRLIEGFIWSEILSKPKAYRSTSIKR